MRVEVFVHPVTGSLVEVSAEGLAEALLAIDQEHGRLYRAADALAKRLKELQRAEDAA